MMDQLHQENSTQKGPPLPSYNENYLGGQPHLQKYSPHGQAYSQPHTGFTDITICDNKGNNSNGTDMSNTSNTSTNREFYCILMYQLLITCIVTAVFAFIKPTQTFVFQRPVLMYAAFTVITVCLLMVACWKPACHTAPIKHIVQCIFTLAESFLVGILLVGLMSSTDFHHHELMVIGICIVGFIGSMVFVYKTRSCFVMCCVLFFMTVFISSHLLLADTLIFKFCIRVLLFSLYPIYDSHLI